jgi:hypothetical protein
VPLQKSILFNKEGGFNIDYVCICKNVSVRVKSCQKQSLVILELVLSNESLGQGLLLYLKSSMTTITTLLSKSGKVLLTLEAKQ